MQLIEIISLGLVNVSRVLFLNFCIHFNRGYQENLLRREKIQILNLEFGFRIRILFVNLGFRVWDFRIVSIFSIVGAEMDYNLAPFHL